MTYILSIAKDGEIIVRLGVTADEALAIVGRAIPKTTEVPEAQPVPETKPRKLHKANKRGKELQKEIEKGHQRKGKVSEEDKAAIEREFMNGLSVAAVYEKHGERLGVSDAWFYLLRSRLRKEGKLT